ncbi:ENTH domain-containing protein [Golovinomyces cichoracearum]|uniref:ENTH domain-containing protein n=1 Tax=Golovinomyces cichoracearum TaxID=62708 RepID=A0A420J5C8_9PEZI|nr:ENTH domain-containing protein [Golovinomyces cichoracearum]
MDFTGLKEAAANLTLYDIKAGVRKVQNAVMNYTEMEAKVREATNNEPWGASSSMMQEIANGTYNYQHLNEIMPIIYKRFTEKAADEWRQIYKALQLLEFLIKNGSERVVDDARSHLTLLKMLRQFHFIDQNGKDQGLNVRNRAKELTELLSDVDRIRAERKKARLTKSKYTGVEGGLGSSGTSRFGGFGITESNSGAGYGGYSGGVYGDGGGYGGQQSDFQDSGINRTLAAAGRDRFEEYDEFAEGSPSSSRKQKDTPASSPPRRKMSEKITKKVEPLKREPEVDLFSFDDAVPSFIPPKAPETISALDDEDDFDEFQSATPSVQVSVPKFPTVVSTATTNSATQYASPQPVSASKIANLTDLAGFNSFSQAISTNSPLSNNPGFIPPAQQPKDNGYQSSQPNYFTPIQVPTSNSQAAFSTGPSNKTRAVKQNSSSACQEDAFGSLWSSVSAGIKKSTNSNSGPALGQLAKEKASAGIWGAMVSSNPTQASQTYQQTQRQTGGLDDLLG